MTTPVSAASPATAMSPTPTAMEKLNPRASMSQTAPTTANGSGIINRSASSALRKWRNSSRKMIASVIGTSTARRRLARSMYSYWPLHRIE